MISYNALPSVDKEAVFKNSLNIPIDNFCMHVGYEVGVFIHVYTM